MEDDTADVFAALKKAGRITNERGRLVVDADKIKRAKLLDILRRVIANPGNAEEVAREIALDWSPMIRIDSRGRMEVVVGTGAKR